MRPWIFLLFISSSSSSLSSTLPLLSRVYTGDCTTHINIRIHNRKIQQQQLPPFPSLRISALADAPRRPGKISAEKGLPICQLYGIATAYVRYGNGPWILLECGFCLLGYSATEKDIEKREKERGKPSPIAQRSRSNGRSHAANLHLWQPDVLQITLAPKETTCRFFGKGLVEGQSFAVLQALKTEKTTMYSAQDATATAWACVCVCVERASRSPSRCHCRNVPDYRRQLSSSRSDSRSTKRASSSSNEFEASARISDSLVCTHVHRKKFPRSR